MIEQHNDFVWAASSLHGTKIIIYDAPTMKSLGSFDAHETRITQITSVNNQVWTASFAEIRIWECAVR